MGYQSTLGLNVVHLFRLTVGGPTLSLIIDRRPRVRSFLGPFDSEALDWLPQVNLLWQIKVVGIKCLILFSLNQPPARLRNESRHGNSIV